MNFMSYFSSLPWILCRNHIQWNYARFEAQV